VVALVVMVVGALGVSASPLVAAVHDESGGHHLLQGSRSLRPVGARSVRGPDSFDAAPVSWGMRDAASASEFSPFDRPVRIAVVGLGRIYDLNVRGYFDNEDVEVVALVDSA
jgi:hypothetical protein